MFLKLMYITNSVDVALIAEKYGVDRIWIDLETLGKQERQGHIDSVKSKHSINDIKKISPKLTKSEMLVRVNPINPCSKEEIDKVIEAGADIITIHQESTSCLYHCLEMIQRKGRMAGVVLSPATPVQNIKYILSLINMVLIMTVNPGEKNQVFLFDMIDKIKEASELLKDKNIDIEVDGSIDDKTAVLCQAAGANVFVSGGYIFNNNNI